MMATNSSNNVEHIALDVRGSGGPSDPPVLPQAISDPDRASSIPPVPVASPGPQSHNQDSGTPIDARRVKGGPPNSSSGQPGDLDDSANALWTLYGKEAKSHDEVRIENLKYDMEGVLLFTGLFAVVLTAFIVDSKKDLKVKPEDQAVYYLQQNVVLLDRISNQIFSIAPQFPIPSAPPDPFPPFKPSASDMRVNVFWFMSLIFSLFAALLATLVQQWVRDYMHVFQQSDPLKSARLRQYLNEGSKNWYMQPVAEAVPALLHVSLFLFFVGLCDFVFNINTTIGLSSTIPIGVIGVLYIVTTVLSIIYPQSPYQNSYSVLIGSAIQKYSRRRSKNRATDGASNLAQRRLQHAMEEPKDRDKQAIRWLVSDMTTDAEMEALVMAIPGSFNGRSGQEVWKDVLDTTQIRGEEIRSELSQRVARLLVTCKNQGHFTSPELWRRRARACVETTSSLFSITRDMPDQIGDMLQLLGDLGRSEKIRNLSLEGRDESLVIHWTCLSLMAVRSILKSKPLLYNGVTQASRGHEQSDNADETRLKKILKAFHNASSCLEPFAGFRVIDATKKQVNQILRNHEPQISKLEEIGIENAELGLDDWSIGSAQHSIDQITHGVITRHLPGVKSDISDTESDDISQFIELYDDRNTLLFISPLQNLRRIRSFAQTIRKVRRGHDDDALQKFRKTIKDLREIEFPLQLDSLFRRQMWRLQDLQDGGLGFTVELFFLALKQLLSKPSSSKESHSELYRHTFHAITSNLDKYKPSLGTQTLFVNMVAPRDGIIFSFECPPDIVTEFLAILGKILEGPRGQHINDVVKQLEDVVNQVEVATSPDDRLRHDLSVKVLDAIRPP